MYQRHKDQTKAKTNKQTTDAQGVEDKINESYLIFTWKKNVTDSRKLRIRCDVFFIHMIVIKTFCGDCTTY